MKLLLPAICRLSPAICRDYRPISETHTFHKQRIMKVFHAQYNMFFAHEPMSRLITSTRGNLVEIVQRVEDGNEGSFLAWNATGLCTRSSIPSFPELIKIFQVRGQLNNKERSTETTPRTLNQLLINIYRAVVNMEHLQHRFLPIGAALTMNNWITLGNLSYVMISLSRMRYFTRIALDYSAGPQINGRTFRFYFPEAWLQLQEAKNDPKHPDYDAVIYEAPHKDPNPYTLFRLHPVLPRSTMDSFIDYWNNFTADNLLKTFPLFAFKMAVRHRLFPMVMMRENLQESIKEHYKEDLENAEELDAKTYAKDTLMDILLPVSTDGWKTLLMLLTRQTDTDEEKLLIQNHEGSPVLKLAKFIVRSEAKYGDTYIPPLMSKADEPCVCRQGSGGGPDLDATNDDTADTPFYEEDIADMSSSFTWNSNVV